MKSISSTLLFVGLLAMYSCSNTRGLKETPVLESVIETKEISLDEAVVIPDTNTYRATEARINDLLHMNLSVSFDWEQRSVLGSAEIRVSPYFYPTSTLVLDAKKMDINSVSLKNGNNLEALQYSYDGYFIRIDLGKTYTRTEEYVVSIDYTAFPEKVTDGGSDAISMAQGIYFINPDSTEVKKPTQLWTQGETESNSVWFPTIDSPNERISQEIQITVKESYKTLSNGELIFSNYNGDGTRTDYWKQELPHAPYLVMMAVGDFDVTIDSWVNKDNEDILVDYYLESEYAPYANDIFGNTPEMLSFYSEVLGYPYPWDKYSQVVVRDFVSGAMENTSAVIHGEFLNATDRELLDYDNEDVIAHELFHHWFGDLVTCESWSNLPLNESFATYGEYLWIEHKYGRDPADLHGMNSMSGYLAEAQTKQENLIRFFYDDKEQMFDGHSYNKGGRILHMLRYFLGDDAFFSGLKLYLEENEFDSVEIHQLRLAMEEISGKDLNWFFNQWFLGKGHPNLEINYLYSEGADSIGIEIKQLQETLFRLPLMVDVFSGQGSYRERLDIRNREEVFYLATNGTLKFVNVDAEKVLLGTKTDNRPSDWTLSQFNNSTVFLDRYEALSYVLANDSIAQAKEVIKKALNDPFWKIRQTALAGAQLLMIDSLSLEKQLISMATNDKKSLVRAAALKSLSELFNSSSHSEIYSGALSDRSYSVMSSGLMGLSKVNPETGIAKAKELEGEANGTLKLTIGEVYANLGNEDQNKFFISTFETAEDYEKYQLFTSYGQYLSRQSPSFIKDNLSLLEKEAADASPWWVRLGAYSGMNDLHKILVSSDSSDPIIEELRQYIPEKIDALLLTEPEGRIKGILGR